MDMLCYYYHAEPKSLTTSAVAGKHNFLCVCVVAFFQIRSTAPTGRLLKRRYSLRPKNSHILQSGLLEGSPTEILRKGRNSVLKKLQGSTPSLLSYPIVDADHPAFRPKQLHFSSRTGLAGYIYTQDYSRAMRFAGKLEVGMVRFPTSRLLEFLHPRYARE